MTDKPLTEKQRAFVAAYVGEAKGNATRAAQLAGYAGNERTLAEQGRRTLGNAGVKQALEVFRMATTTDRIMSAEEAAARLSTIARGGGSGEDALTEKRVVSGGPAGFIEADVPPGFSHQIDAIKQLSKMRGYESATKTEVTGVVGLAQLTPEQDAALATWLRWRQDPVIAARIAELEGDG